MSIEEADPIIVTASTEQGEEGYLTLDWQAIGNHLGRWCVGPADVDLLHAFLLSIGYDSAYDLAEMIPGQLADAQVEAEWIDAWDQLARQVRSS